jgi:hypothetical protein
MEVIATAIFAIAVLHTFSTRYFQRLAHANPSHAGLWHLLGEVEVVFGFWAMVLLLFLVVHSGSGHAVHYLVTRNFTEPAFVFVVMVIAAGRPILDLARALLHLISPALPFAPRFSLCHVDRLRKTTHHQHDKAPSPPALRCATRYSLATLPRRSRNGHSAGAH